jgi:cephalosporin hydroxylase
MRLLIDTEKRTISHQQGNSCLEMNLYSKEAFEAISQIWMKVAWNERYIYTFSWLGRPVIQNPEDMIRAQEVVYRIQPDVIIETGVAHGGSLIFYASLCKVINKGRIIGIDIKIRPHNRQAIERHELSPFITLIEGSSIDPVVVENVKSLVKDDETVLVFLDSCHTKEHVLAELQAYHGFVSKGSYIVATDGIMKDLYDVPRGQPGWKHDHPAAAAAEFVHGHPEFVLEKPPWPFNESNLNENVTYWPDAYLKKIIKGSE